MSGQGAAEGFEEEFAGEAVDLYRDGRREIVGLGQNYHGFVVRKL